MKVSFFLLLSAFSISAFAQRTQVPASSQLSYVESSDFLTVMSENPCINGADRVKVEMILNRDEKSEQEFIGVTSYGDIAVLKDNNKLTVLKCKRLYSPDIVSTPFNISVAGAFEGCSFGQILSMSVYGDGVAQRMNFRSPMYSDRSALCEIKSPSISDAARDAGKNIEEVYKDAISGTKVSNQ